MNSNAKLSAVTKKYPNYKKANWDRFRQDMNKNLVMSGGLKTIEGIDLEVDKIVGLIQNAIKKSVHEVKVNNNKKYLSDEIQNLIGIRSNLRNLIS